MRTSRRLAAAVVAVASLLGTGMALTGCSSSDPDRLAVVVDTDLSADDVLALLWLSARPDVDLRAVTVSGTGVTRCQTGVRDARWLLDEVGLDSVPVACGPSMPLAGDPAYPDAWRDQAAGMYGLVPESAPSASSVFAGGGVPTLTAAVRDGATTILSLAPMTTLATALAGDTGLRDNIDAVFAMAGAVHATGNVDHGGQLSAAEWNAYADPAALQAVFDAGLALTLVPLDATNDAPLDTFVARATEQAARTRPAELAAELFRRNPPLVDGGFWFWDPVAAQVMVDAAVATTRTERLRVVTQGPDRGRTVVDTSGARVRVARHVDGPRFESAFVAGLNGDGVRPSSAEPLGHAAPDVRVVAAPSECRLRSAPAHAIGQSDVTLGVTGRDADWRLLLAAVDGDHSEAELRAIAAAPDASVPSWVHVYPPIIVAGHTESVHRFDLEPGGYALGCVDPATGATTIAGMFTVRSPG